ncbi:MAG: IS66 family transposase [Planctomycetaceae bacterium]|nr:IS66 family transposase [Planctomycetaceae bacterium]
MQDPATLPKPQLLKVVATQTEQLTAQAKEVAKRDDIIKQLEAKIEVLEKDYLKLWQERFAAKSERYIEDPQQLRIDFGDTDEAADAADGLEEAGEEAGLKPEPKPRKKRKKRDESLPAHLPRKETTVDVPEADKQCETHGEKTLLPESMWDVLEKMVYVPPQFFVEVRKFPKYACPNQPECGIASAERPTGIVEGDKYDASVAAEILVNKFAYHLPIYRQQDLFAGTGWTPSRSTMLNILTNCYFILQPLLAYFKQVVLTDSIVACDDTGVTLLYPKVPPDFDLSDPKQKRIAEVFEEALKNEKPSINAKMWAYRGQAIKLNVFDFTVSRHRDGPDCFFEDYRGTILGDCWHGFGSIAAESDGAIVRAACNSHARRKFEDATDYPADRRKWMSWYQTLFDIETRAKLLSDAERLLLRQSESKVVWDAMRVELDSIDDRTEQVVLPKSDFRKALNYLRNHWTELTRYLDDSQLPMDNNECEQLMKQVGLGRKNWLFAGSVAGGERNAGFITLVSSAHRNDLDVRAYVNDILQRLLAGETDYEPMLPWNWAATHPESIREFRQDERRQRDTRKQTERAKRRVRQQLLESQKK